MILILALPLRCPRSRWKTAKRSRWPHRGSSTLQFTSDTWTNYISIFLVFTISGSPSSPMEFWAIYCHKHTGTRIGPVGSWWAVSLVENIRAEMGNLLSDGRREKWPKAEKRGCRGNVASPAILPEQLEASSPFSRSNAEIGYRILDTAARRPWRTDNYLSIGEVVQQQPFESKQYLLTE